jgi:hypothetical protein
MKKLEGKIKRKCKFCRRVFTPDPRVGDRQISCQNTVCKRKRKKTAQKKWTKNNPDYFHGRYTELRYWRENNPAYQKEWRNKKNEIQDKIEPKKPLKSIRLILPTCILKNEIQDEILLKHECIQGVTSVFVHEIQDEI